MKATFKHTRYCSLFYQKLVKENMFLVIYIRVRYEL